MIKINVLENEGIQDPVKKFISALLPHEEYDAKFFLGNLSILFKYIKLEEFTMEFRMLLEALADFGKLKLSFEEYEPLLEQEIFSTLVEASVSDAVMRPDIGIREWLDSTGFDSDLENEVTRENACQTLWQRCIDLYEECFSLEVPSCKAANYEPELREAFKSCVSLQSINNQIAIVRGAIRVGRKRYSGVDGWLEYSGILLAEINTRLSDADGESTIILDSAESSLKLLRSMAGYYESIADWGIPELDDMTPISRHKLVTVVGNENIGKTKFMINAATQVLLAEKRVAYMCGETKQAVVYTDIIINYVYKKYGYILRPEHVYSFESCPEDIRKVVGMTIDHLTSNKLLVLEESFNYDTCFDEISSLYQTVGFDVLIIDHSCALGGTVGDGSLKAKVDKLARDARVFRKNNPVCIIISSHPSQTAKEALTRDREVTESPTKGSQDLSTDSDEVYILRENETLKKQGLLKLENFKRRGAAKFINPVILQKKFEVSCFIYDENKQAVDSVMELEKQQALAALEVDSNDEIYSL